MPEDRLYCIRGATCAQNTPTSITQNVGILCSTIVEQNKLDAKNIVAIQFTTTPDLDSLNPATALRRSKAFEGTESIPLFCSAEPVIQNMKPLVIRVMFTVYLSNGADIVNVYLNGAQSLRPDLAASMTRNC